MRTSNFYIVSQEPKNGLREGYVVKVILRRATSAAAALRLTAHHFSDCTFFKKPQASLLVENHLYRF